MWSVFFVFLSYLDRNFVKGDFLSRALDAEKESKEIFSIINGTFCAKMSTVRENFIYQVSDGAEAVSSVVSPAGKLMDCSVIVNQMQVKAFMHECRLGLRDQRSGRQLETHFARMDEAKLMCRELRERSQRSGRVRKHDDSAQQDQVLKRSKRGFTYPGTLWCGAGNMADNYDQLGDFAQTDSCCRTHDHCPHVIHAFSSNYGYTNFKWHSICHCNCDAELRDCLRKVNDTSSRVVGQAFFNVIGVPCFEFAYEEQCAERHWYGMCKRYEKFPVAVLKEAVPYDFGGIDVIDQLTLAPPTKKDSKKNEEKEKPESNTQSTMSGPEEPSLRNVVTAAEDFIKVLATVSTSQSSTADSDKSETQSSEKKKRKNTGKKKKTTKKQKGKGKGRKRKQKAEAGVKIEEGAAVSTSGSKAEEVIALSNFISESRRHDQPSRNRNRVDDSEFELARKEESSNEVMKDEPAKDEEASVTSPSVQKKAATEEIPTSTTTFVPLREKTRRFRNGRRKKSRTVPLPTSEELVTNTTDNLGAASVPTIKTITPVTQSEQQSLGTDEEKRPVVSTARSLIEAPTVKKSRSKERGDRERRKKSMKVTSASPIVATARENSSADNLKAIPLSGAPTIPSAPTTERQVSHRLDIYGGKTAFKVTALNSTFSVLRQRKSKERALRSRRRKTVLPPSGDDPPSHNSSENVLPVLPTPETSDALDRPATTAAISRNTEQTETHAEWRLFTSVTAAPSITTKRHRQTISGRKKASRKEAPAALGDGVSIPEHSLMTFTATPFKVTTADEHSRQRSVKSSMTTSATAVMSPIQLSIQRAKAQFTRKKRRKAALSARQH